jgi:hypothetical protein
MQGMQSIEGMAGQFGHGGQSDDASANVDGPSADHPQSDQPADNQGKPEDKKQDDAAEPRHQGAAPHRERLEAIPDSPADGATGGHPANPPAPAVTPPAPARPVRPPTEIL